MHEGEAERECKPRKRLKLGDIHEDHKLSESSRPLALLLVYMRADKRVLDERLPQRSPFEGIALSPPVSVSPRMNQDDTATHRVALHLDEGAGVPAEFEVLEDDVALHVDLAPVLRADAHAQLRHAVWVCRVRGELLGGVLLHAHLGERVHDEHEQRVGAQLGEEAREGADVARPPAAELGLQSEKREGFVSVAADRGNEERTKSMSD